VKSLYDYTRKKSSWLENYSVSISRITAGKAAAAGGYHGGGQPGRLARIHDLAGARRAAEFRVKDEIFSLTFASETLLPQVTCAGLYAGNRIARICELPPCYQ
jgi:hypothetical protein